MRMLEVETLHAGYGDGPDVLADATLDVARGEVVALLGASGSGKSTLLRCVAGLHAVRRGRIRIGGEDVVRTPVERRAVGLVFQDHALFPHRDVAGNVGFGPRMQGHGPDAVAARVRRALDDVGLTHLATRAVDELSGGEQQRVALARALAASPRLLLLDEPYGSLDRPLRARLAGELPALVRSQDIACLLVTHDREEALQAADRIAVLVAGTVRQLADPATLWSDPADPDVAAFLGVGPLLPCEVRGGTAHGPFGTLALPGVPAGRGMLLLPHAALRLGRRPGEDGLTATVIGSRFAGDHHRITAVLPDGTPVTVRAHELTDAPQPGSGVELGVRTASLRLFPATSGREPDAAGQ